MEFQAFLCWVIAFLTGGCAVLVVVTQNIVRCATWLLFALGGTAGVFFLLGADFVGAAQILVYVGGTLVLVVFGVMLTAQGPFITMKTGAAEWAIAALVGLVLFGVLVLSVLPSQPEAGGTDPNRMNDPGTSMSSALLGEALLGIEEATPKARRRLPGSGQAPARNSIMTPIGLHHYLILGALLFVCGALCMANKRNAIGVLMGVELVLNGANINFVAFARFNPTFEIEGQIFALFIIVLAAAEAAIALAIVLNFYNNHLTVDVDSAEELKG
jgi:NADH-quinone oxidoreductase subunit K